MEKIDLLLKGFSLEITHVTLVSGKKWSIATYTCKGVGSWPASHFSEATPFSGRGNMIFGGSWSSLQHVAPKAMCDLVCFYWFIWGHQHNLPQGNHSSHSLWDLTLQLPQNGHDTLSSILSIPGSSCFRVFTHPALLQSSPLPPSPPLWFFWAISHNSFRFNLNIFSSERLSWPPHTNLYLSSSMLSHGAMFFFFLIHV